MSAANFIKIFKDLRKSITGKSDFDIYNRWVQKNKTWFNRNRDQLVAEGLSNKIDFLVTEDKAEILGVAAEFNSLIRDISSKKIDGPIIEYINGKPAVLFPNIAFKGGIERTLDKYFGGGTFEKSRKLKYVKGHVYGLMTGALVGATEQLQDFLSGEGSNVPIFEKNAAEAALNFLDVLIDHLTILDEQSSDIKQMSGSLRVKYRKKATSFLVELQLEEDNSESAKVVKELAGQIGGNTGIRGLINPGASQEKILTDIVSKLRKDGKFSNREVADFESSPSMKSLVIQSVVNTIKGKKIPLKTYSESIEIPDRVVLSYVDEVGKKAYQTKLRQLKQEAIRSKAKIQKNKSKLSTTSMPNTSVASLEGILRSRLALQVRKNMGTGSAKNVLNYRTGRFAESVEIDHITTSRAGMVSVFYNYMRNPYGTFSEGGLQQYPKSRDPKLLISKSIREIGATLVGNRMRAVLV